MPPSHTLQIFTAKFHRKTYNTNRYLLTESYTTKDDASQNMNFTLYCKHLSHTDYFYAHIKINVSQTTLLTRTTDGCFSSCKTTMKWNTKGTFNHTWGFGAVTPPPPLFFSTNPITDIYHEDVEMVIYQAFYN